jgi:hypothetical protein
MAKRRIDLEIRTLANGEIAGGGELNQTFKS